MLAGAAFVLLVSGVVADEPGFGGDPGAASESAPAVPDDDTCTVKGDDGVWRTCAEVLAKKSSAADDKAPEDDPQTAALKKQMREAEALANAAPAPRPKTKLELDLDKAKLDPTLPLLALRVDVARDQDDVDDLEKKGIGGERKDAALEKLAEAQSLLDDVERVGLHRMDVCLQRRGKKPLTRNYRMTAAGPVMLTTKEMMAALPMVDPVGCERIFAVDEKVVTRIKRVHEIKKIFATRSFGYYELDQRRALEHELNALEEELAKDATSSLSAPGVKDPLGH